MKGAAVQADWSAIAGVDGQVARSGNTDGVRPGKRISAGVEGAGAGQNASGLDGDGEGVTPPENGVIPVCEYRSLPVRISLLRRIRASACDGVRVAELLRPEDGSRRSLEMKFRQYLNRSIENEIRRCRLQHARDLLMGTSLSIEAVAEQCGFANTPHFSRLFKATHGHPPLRYRERFRER